MASEAEYTVASDSEISDVLRGATEPQSPAIGIDLGTAYSRVAVWHEGKVEVIANHDGVRSIPSNVVFRDDAAIPCAVGRAGDDDITSGRVAIGMTRLIGRTDSDPTMVKFDSTWWPFLVEGIGIGVRPVMAVMQAGVWRSTTPEEILAVIMMELKTMAENFLGRAVRNAVLTMPSTFSRFQQARLERAGTMAGLNIIRVMPEPTAVALVYAQQQQMDGGGGGGATNLASSGVEKRVVIFSLGAGGCDVAVAATEGGVAQIKAIVGEVFGAEDFCRALVDAVAERLMVQYGCFDPRSERRSCMRLRLACEDAMRELSQSEIVNVCFPDEDVGDEKHKRKLVVTVTRSDFESVNHKLFDRCRELVIQCLKDASLRADDVSDVVLTGGCTHMPRVREILRSIFSQIADDSDFCRDIGVEEGAVRGAALEAAITNGVTDPGLDLLVVQTTPMSLGIGIGHGEVAVVLPKNVTIPARREVVLTTAADNQTEALITVYEGESRKASENHFLGFFKVPEIPRAPKGVPVITVCMDLDASDTLRVIVGVHVAEGKLEVKADEARRQAYPIEVRMPNVDDGHSWCVEALKEKLGTTMDVCIRPVSKQASE